LKIYLDNTASTPLLNEVIDCMNDTMLNLFANPSSIHFHGRNSKVAIETARKSIAKYLNCTPSEIFFTSGGTEANNMALYGCVYDLGVKHVITSPIEHHAVLETLENFVHRGLIEIHFVKINEKGQIDYDSLENLLKTYPASLVSLMHANNEISNLLSINKVSRICRKYDAIFHSDTVQTICHYKIDLQKTDVDFVSCSAHKFHGPKGIGFIYINKNRVKISPLLFGGGQERGMRGGTENIYGVVGMAKAFEIAHQNMDLDMRKILSLKSYMIENLNKTFVGIEYLGDSATDGLYTVLSVLFPENVFDDMLLMRLDIEGVSASSGSACTSGALKGSHVMKHLKIPENRQTVRFSFSKFNTIEEIDFCIEVLKKIKNS